MADGPKIPTAPSGTPNSGAPTGSGSGSGGSGGGSGSSGGGGGGGDPYLAAQKKAQKKASQRYIRQAQTLNQQIRAIKKSLNSTFKAALDQRLENVMEVLRDSDAAAMKDYRQRVNSLEGAEADNQKAAAGQGMAALSNRGRERANAMSEAMLQGAGESDLLRAQEMSLRNWNANQSEIQRGFFDTQRSINSSLTDLTVDTRTARINLALEANADKEQYWNAYWAQRSEALTQLGNLYGEQANLYGMANEQVGSKKTRGMQNRADNLSGNAFMQSANVLGNAWDNPGIPKHLRKWDGRDQFSMGRRSESRFINRPVDVAVARPEGATLRTWAGDES